MSKKSISPPKLEHAVIKLINGDELVCRVEMNVIDFIDDFVHHKQPIKIYHPLKAETREYFSKENGVYEETIMTSWLKFAYLEQFDLPVDRVMLVVRPKKTVVDNYDDLTLKYHTYNTNPELAYELYGFGSDNDDVPREDDILDDIDDDDDEDNLEEEYD